MATKKSATRKYSPAASKSVEREMKAMKEGKPDQRTQRQEGHKPQAGDRHWVERGSCGGKEGSATARASPAKKSSAKKAAAKKAAGKKAALPRE